MLVSFVFLFVFEQIKPIDVCGLHIRLKVRNVKIPSILGSQSVGRRNESQGGCMGFYVNEQNYTLKWPCPQYSKLAFRRTQKFGARLGYS